MSLPITLTFLLSTWQSSCAVPAQASLPLSCDVPQLNSTPVKLNLSVTFPDQAGQADFNEQRLSVTATGTQNTIDGFVRVDAIHPPIAQRLPNYFYIEVELTAPIRTICSFSPRADWGQLPPLVCSGTTDLAGQTGKLIRYGVTLQNLSAGADVVRTAGE